MIVLDAAEPSPLEMGAVFLEGLSFLECVVLAVEDFPEALPSLGCAINFASSLEISMRVLITPAFLF
jgi:hypothetical protein